MSQDHPIDRQLAGPEVIELAEGERPEAPRSPWGVRAGLLRNHRLVPVIAGLGLAAVVASLFGEWSTLTVADDGQTLLDRPRLPVRIADLTAYGAAYLIGQLAVVGALALVLFGTPAIRHNCRILGIATAGGLLALLATLTANLDRATPWPAMLNPEIELHAEPGRGLVMAYAGTAVLGLALYLAGRFIPSPTDPAGPADPADPAELPGDDDRPWRRRPRASVADIDADEGAPLDLTVTPITPFAVPGQPDER